MKRREFIKNGIVLFAAPTIIKIENLMRVAPLREVTIVTHPLETPFEEFMENIMRQVSASLEVPYDLMIKQYKSEIET